jgi:hypothetical protein
MLQKLAQQLWQEDQDRLKIFEDELGEDLPYQVTSQPITQEIVAMVTRTADQFLLSSQKAFDLRDTIDGTLERIRSHIGNVIMPEITLVVPAEYMHALIHYNRNRGQAHLPEIDMPAILVDEVNGKIIVPRDYTRIKEEIETYNWTKPYLEMKIMQAHAYAHLRSMRREWGDEFMDTFGEMGAKECKRTRQHLMLIGLVLAEEINDPYMGLHIVADKCATVYKSKESMIEYVGIRVEREDNTPVTDIGKIDFFEREGNAIVPRSIKSFNTGETQQPAK